jgi:hypothetical protein
MLARKNSFKIRARVNNVKALVVRMPFEVDLGNVIQVARARARKLLRGRVENAKGEKWEKCPSYYFPLVVSRAQLHSTILIF